MKFPKFLKALFLILIMLATFTPALVHADGGVGGGLGAIPDRVAGVHPGLFATYSHDVYGSKSILNLTVTGVNNSTILFNMTETFANGIRYSALVWTNVNGAILIFSTPTGTSYDYTRIGVPNFFVGANLWGGAEYKGSDLSMSKSFFGKIVLGNLRSTNYISSSGYGAVAYEEWDYETGLLTVQSFYYKGAGFSYTLAKTNAWTNHIPFWDGVFTVQNVLNYIFSIVMPVVGVFILTYLFSFIFFGISDNIRVKKARGLKVSVVPPWLKMILITAVIFIGLWIAVLYFIFPLIMGSLAGK